MRPGSISGLMDIHPLSCSWLQALAIPGANHFEVLDGFGHADGLMTRTLMSLLERR